MFAKLGFSNVAKKGFFALGMTTLLAISSVAHADTSWPNRPIRMIVPSAPAGGVDIVARIFAEKLSIALRQPVVVENKPGAGGILGTSQVAKSPADGYTILAGFAGPIAIATQLNKSASYDIARDFVPVSRVGDAYNVLVVNPSVPVSNVKELISYAKTHPLNFGSTGIGAADHLAGELFNSMAGVSMTHVPYKGGAPAMQELMGGQIQVIFATVSTAVAAIDSGKIRALGMAGNSRFEKMPNVPTISESGLPGFQISNWYGFLLPAGTPSDIVQRLSQELRKAAKSEDIRDRLLKAGIAPTTDTPAEFASYIQSESAKWKKIIEDAHVVVE